jgi:plasmid stabilization system protein ParE
VRVRYSSLARTDIREAKAFYGRDSEQAPRDFAAELRSALRRIREHPQIGTPYEMGTRRLVMRFHHSVVYYVTVEGIYVVAVEHHKRDSEYWMKFLSESS